jgi:hypothetical protein
MQLYKIDSAIEEAINLGTDPETGELLSIDEVEALLMEKQTKIENIACWIKNLKSDVEALKAERDAFNDRIRTTTNKLVSLEAYLTFCLNGEKFESDKCKITYRKSESLDVVNEPALIEWAEANDDTLLRYKAPEIDKAKVKNLLKQGFEVPFAELKENQNMQIK